MMRVIALVTLMTLALAAALIPSRAIAAPDGGPIPLCRPGTSGCCSIGNPCG